MIPLSFRESMYRRAGEPDLVSELQLDRLKDWPHDSPVFVQAVADTREESGVFGFGQLLGVEIDAGLALLDRVLFVRLVNRHHQRARVVASLDVVVLEIRVVFDEPLQPQPRFVDVVLDCSGVRQARMNQPRGDIAAVRDIPPFGDVHEAPTGFRVGVFRDHDDVSVFVEVNGLGRGRRGRVGLGAQPRASLFRRRLLHPHDAGLVDELPPRLRVGGRARPGLRRGPPLQHRAMRRSLLRYVRQLVCEQPLPARGSGRIFT